MTGNGGIGHRRTIYGLLLLLMIPALFVGLVAGVVLDRVVLVAFLPLYTIPPGEAPSFALITEAWNKIEQLYVDRQALQSSTLTYGAIRGMVEALGDTGHSRFLTPEDVARERDFVAGEFEGVGIEVQVRDGNLVVVAPIDNSPAQRAGIQPGDVILQVDGEQVSNLSLDQVMSRIRGPAGTDVTLTLLDPATSQTRQVTLTRARIPVQNVIWAPIQNTTIAHLRIASFSDGVGESVRQALQEIQQQGYTQLILDLRNNPGGLLNEAVQTTSQFLASGDVLLQQDANGNVTPVPVQPGGVATQMPMVTLVNGGTGSGAEILSGALQDARRSLLVGETTFGTGTVLRQYPLSDGSAILLATEQWLTPSGRVIWKQGIAPDIRVLLPNEATPVFPTPRTPIGVPQITERGDTQLLRAIEQLTGALASRVR